MLKLLLVGSAGVGKTSLISEYCDKEHPSAYIPSTTMEFVSNFVIHLVRECDATLLLQKIRNIFLNKRTLKLQIVSEPCAMACLPCSSQLMLSVVAQWDSPGQKDLRGKCNRYLRNTNGVALVR